jgi:ribosomal protein S18 acetylase RimI-like enzyme
MTLVIAPATPEEAPTAARLLAETMAGFGVAVLGLGDEQLELKAMAKWFAEKDNRFSYQFARIARLDGEIAGLLLCFSGRDAERLSLNCRHSMRQVYGIRQVIKLIWRGMVLGHTREAEKDEYLVAHVAVFEQFRRKGIAKALLDKTAADARIAGFKKCVLEVEIGNTPAITLYHGYGFRTQFTTEFGRHAKLLQCPGYHKMVLHQ